MPSARFIPNHIGVIMDGNRRYAHKNEIDVFLGHRRGSSSAAKTLKWAYNFNIKNLTLYTFSFDNFSRDETEKKYIFNLLNNILDSYSAEDNTFLKNKGIRIRVVGDLSLIPEELSNKILEVEEKTKNNSNMFLNIAFAYGGREDISYAFNKSEQELIEKERTKKEPIDISNYDLIEKMLDKNIFKGITPNVPDIDLIIRTGGERRMSNFLPWHAFGNEAVFHSTGKLWPQFSKYDFLFALQKYKQIKKNQNKQLEMREKFIKDYISKNKIK
ncbi:MAG: di-trans,poly-cis-decaprenylcistransferase [Methanosarcinaceae archaeon]|nr:di-trans,poly-cis-decaprenylcistransferase [Methanosarcinaceae archaeon]